MLCLKLGVNLADLLAVFGISFILLRIFVYGAMSGTVGLFFFALGYFTLTERLLFSVSSSIARIGAIAGT